MVIAVNGGIWKQPTELSHVFPLSDLSRIYETLNFDASLNFDWYVLGICCSIIEFWLNSLILAYVIKNKNRRL